MTGQIPYSNGKVEWKPTSALDLRIFDMLILNPLSRVSNMPLQVKACSTTPCVRLCFRCGFGHNLARNSPIVAVIDKRKAAETLLYSEFRNGFSQGTAEHFRV